MLTSRSLQASSEKLNVKPSGKPSRVYLSPSRGRVGNLQKQVTELADSTNNPKVGGVLGLSLQENHLFKEYQPIQRNLDTYKLSVEER